MKILQSTLLSLFILAFSIFISCSENESMQMTQDIEFDKQIAVSTSDTCSIEGGSWIGTLLYEGQSATYCMMAVPTGSYTWIVNGDIEIIGSSTNRCATIKPKAISSVSSGWVHASTVRLNKPGWICATEGEMTVSPFD